MSTSILLPSSSPAASTPPSHSCLLVRVSASGALTGGGSDGRCGVDELRSILARNQATAAVAYAAATTTHEQDTAAKSNSLSLWQVCATLSGMTGPPAAHATHYHPSVPVPASFAGHAASVASCGYSTWDDELVCDDGRRVSVAMQLFADVSTVGGWLLSMRVGSTRPASKPTPMWNSQRETEELELLFASIKDYSIIMLDCKGNNTTNNTHPPRLHVRPDSLSPFPSLNVYVFVRVCVCVVCQV